MALFAAVLCGLWNGVLVAYVRMQPMVATLILMIAGRGIAQLSTNSIKIIIFNDAFAFLGNGFIILPFSLFVVAALFLGIVAADPQDRARAVRGVRRHQLPRRASTAASTRSA